MDGDLEEYRVVDAAGQVISQVEYVWRDGSGAPEFVGVEAGTFGRTHLVPLAQATIDSVQRTIAVPYFHDTIRATRHLAPGTELTSQDRWELYNDYNLTPPAPGAGSPAEAEAEMAPATGDDAGLDTPANPV